MVWFRRENHKSLHDPTTFEDPPLIFSCETTNVNTPDWVKVLPSKICLGFRMTNVNFQLLFNFGLLSVIN
jgi:hypothetical protein